MTPGDDEVPRAARRGRGDSSQRAETAAVWRKSSYSASNGGQCVEVAHNLPAIVAVRDSTDRHGARLALPPAAWAAFVDRVKRENCLAAARAFAAAWWPVVIPGPGPGYRHQVPE